MEAAIGREGILSINHMANGKRQIGIRYWHGSVFFKELISLQPHLAIPWSHSVASIDRSLLSFDDETINIDFKSHLNKKKVMEVNNTTLFES